MCRPPDRVARIPTNAYMSAAQARPAIAPFASPSAAGYSSRVTSEVPAGERAAKHAAIALIGGLILAPCGVLVGAAVMIAMLIDVFGAVAYAEPSARSALLSDGIEGAIGTGLGVGGTITFVGAILLGLAAWGGARARKR